MNRWLLTVGILTAASGCDNVSWGGMQVSLEGPPGDSLETASDSLAASDPSAALPPTFDLEALLYAGVRRGDSALVVPVAELADGTIRPLPEGDLEEALGQNILETRLAPGTLLTLFHQGVRIGTMTVSDHPGFNTDHCATRPQAAGPLELVPAAMDVQHFLALEGPAPRALPFEPFQALASAYSQRVASLNLGGEALNELRARWPSRLLDIRQDLQVFRLTSGEGPSVISTFLFRDQLQVGGAPEDAYSLLILGEPRGNQFERTYTWFRRVGEDGKGAPRFFSRLDWDGDGEEEILLEVLGESSRWWAALDRRRGEWELAFQDACGAPGQGGDSPEGQGGVQ